MLQVVKDKTQHDNMKNLEKEMRNATISAEESCFDEDVRWSNFDSNRETFDDEEYQWKFFEMTQTTKVDQQGVRTLLEKIEDDGMEDMVKQEGPIQIINLLVENQTNNIMFRKLSDSNDLGDWMQCVAKEKERRNNIFLNKQQDDCPKVFQLDTDNVEKQVKPQPTINHHNNNDSC